MNRCKTRLDWDECSYMGIGLVGGCYYGAEKDDQGWWALCTVDANHFTQDLPDEGPFRTEQEAHNVARYSAFDWCATNEEVPCSAS